MRSGNKTSKIVKIWKNDYPWDIRVEKMMNTLSEYGFEVHLVCRNINKLKKYEERNGIYIHRLYPFKIGIINAVYSLPIFFNPFWFSKLYRIINSVNPKLIIVRDLPLAPLTVLIGSLKNIPVIFDMAENYPAMWKELEGIVNRFIKNTKTAELMENYVLKRADHIFVVVEESQKRLLEKGVDINKVSVISNTPELETLYKDIIKKKDYPHLKFTLIYAGYINKYRGIDIIIKSLKKLKNSIPNIQFIIIGNGNYLNYLRKLAKDENVNENIQFVGWINFQQLTGYIETSDIGLVPHVATEHKNTTVPNKLFDYMAFKKPVIVSDAKPLKRIVEEEGCGIVFQSGDINSFIEGVLRLWQYPDLRKQMGERGFQAIKEKYNWRHDSKELIHILDKYSN